MKTSRNKSAFTLIELLVVISIIGILITIAVPNIATALTRAKLTETLANARSIQQATQMMTLDSQNAGTGIVWTTDVDETGNAAPVSITKFFNALTQDGYMTTQDLKKLMSAPGKLAGDNPSAASVAFNFFEVSETSPSDQILLATKNWTQGSGMNATIDPYGNKGFVYFTKGGGGGALTRQTDATDTKKFPTTDPNDPNVTYKYQPISG